MGKGSAMVTQSSIGRTPAPERHLLPPCAENELETTAVKPKPHQWQGRWHGHPKIIDRYRGPALRSMVVKGRQYRGECLQGLGSARGFAIALSRALNFASGTTRDEPSFTSTALLASA